MKAQARFSLYLLAILITSLLILIPLITDITIHNSSFSKAFISVPFILVILGKLMSIWRKKKKDEGFSGDVGINIGLIIGLVLFLLS